MILETIIGALVPIAAEGLKQLAGRFLGGINPTTIDEQIRLMQAENERAKAIAALDQPGGVPRQWVIDLRASARYVGALTVIGVGVGSLFMQVDAKIQAIALEAANIAFGFLFGSRITAQWSFKK